MASGCPRVAAMQRGRLALRRSIKRLVRKRPSILLPSERAPSSTLQRASALLVRGGSFEKREGAEDVAPSAVVTAFIGGDLLQRLVEAVMSSLVMARAGSPRMEEGRR